MLLNQYILHLESRSRSPETITVYDRVIGNVLGFIKDEFGISGVPDEATKIKGYMVDAYYRTLTIQSTSTKNMYVTIIQGFFKFLLRSGYIDTDPSLILHKERVTENDDFEDDSDKGVYNSEDVVKLIMNCGGYNSSRDRAIIATLTGGGFRASELCSMDISTYKNMRNGRMYIKRKGGAWRWVNLSDYALKFIDTYLNERGYAEDDEPLFTTRDGNRMTRNTLWTTLSRRQKELDLTTGVHILRHTFLTGAKNVGGLKVAQGLANHTDEQTTRGYIHTTAEQRREVANNVEWAKMLDGEENS